MLKTPLTLLTVTVYLGVLCFSSKADEKENAVDAGTQSLVLMITPVVFNDFDNPQEDTTHFYNHFYDFMQGWNEVVIIFAVGQAEHVLAYRGMDYMDDKFPWAVGMSQRTNKISPRQIRNICRCLRRKGRELGLNVKIFDMLEPGPEFCACPWKYKRHREAIRRKTEDGELFELDITTQLKPDNYHYAAYPNGIPEGLHTADFVASQTNQYVRDLNFDGIYLCNALGTVGAWRPKWGRGYRDKEAQVILEFFKTLKKLLGHKQIIWMDSYYSTEVERQSWSIPTKAYDYMDMIQISTWSVIVDPETIRKNLASKIKLNTPVIFQIDYLDPWYNYDSIQNYIDETEQQLAILRKNISAVDGVYINCNDETGRLLPTFWCDRIKHHYLKSNNEIKEMIASRTSSEIKRIQQTYSADEIPQELADIINRTKYHAYLVTVAADMNYTNGYPANLARTCNKLIKMEEKGIIKPEVTEKLAEYLTGDLLFLTRFNYKFLPKRREPYVMFNLENRSGTTLRGSFFTRGWRKSGKSDNVRKFGPLKSMNSTSAVLKANITNSSSGPLIDDLIVKYSYQIPENIPQRPLNVHLREWFPLGPHWVVQRGQVKSAVCDVKFVPDGSIQVTRRIRLAANAAGLSDDSFVRQWLVAGPFTCNPKDFDRSTHIENHPVKADDSFLVNGKKLTWEKCSFDKPYFDLDKATNSQQLPNRCVYVLSWIHCPEDTNAVFRICTKKIQNKYYARSTAVFVNERKVFSKYKEGATNPEPDFIQVKLKEGWNAVLLKIAAHEGPWGFTFQAFGSRTPADTFNWSTEKLLSTGN